MNKPTPDEIEAKLVEMMNGDPNGSEVDCDFDDLWWVEAIDPAGKLRGVGTDLTVAGSLVAAWIGVWDMDDEAARCWGDGTPISKRFYDSVPRQVPAGWTFTINRPDEIVFERI